MSDGDLLQADMLASSFAGPILFLDRSLCITAWNRMYETMYGASAGITYGLSFLAAFPAADIPRIRTAIRDALRGNSTFIPAEENYVHSYFDSHFSPLKNRDGLIIGIMHAGYDASSRLQAQAQLQQLNAQFITQKKELCTLKEIFLHIHKAIKNNLSAPMHRLCSFIGMLKNKISGTATGEQYYDRIRKIADNSKDVLDNLLAYMALEEEATNLEEINLHSLFLFIKSTLREEINIAGACIEWHHLSRIKAARRQVYLVFTELIRNALRYRKKDIPLHISIESGNEKALAVTGKPPEVNTYTWVSITDNGIGIDGPDAAQFQLFNKKQDSIHAGHGVGLAMCKKIMEKHKGRIDITSTLGVGTKVTCSFPVAGDKTD